MAYVSFGNLGELRQFNPAWRLLSADNAPFICSFLNQEFLERNVREISESRLLVKLDDFMKDTNYFEDTDISSKDLLTSWTEKAWLRKFFVNKTDEVHYDLTSWSQKAIEWLASLKQDDFVGTESRLIMFFKLIDDIIDGTSVDPKKRIKDLKRRKKEIDLEIQSIQKGNLSVLEPVQIKDRFIGAMQAGRDILSDFREVEENFRSLDREMREKITSWTGGKGLLLADFFENNDKIGNSEQGKSFNAFYDFLASNNAQESFRAKIDEILKLQAVKEIPNSEKIKNISRDWANGSEHVMNTMQGLSYQLNKYISDNYLEEERKINQIIKNIEKKAVELRGNSDNKNLDIYIDTAVPEINLNMHRPLFTPPIRHTLTSQNISEGAAFGDENILYSQVYVDKTKLKEQINICVKNSGVSTLKEITDKFPLEYGLSEIVAYVAIAGGEKQVDFDYSITEKFFWETDEGVVRSADLPKIVFKGTVKIEV